MLWDTSPLSTWPRKMQGLLLWWESWPVCTLVSDAAEKLRGILVFISLVKEDILGDRCISVIKTVIKTSWGGKGFFHLISLWSHSITEGSQAKNLKWKPWNNAAWWLFHSLLSALSLPTSLLLTSFIILCFFLNNFFRFTYFMYMSVLPVCILCTMCTPGACSAHKRMLDALEVELWMVGCHHGDAGKRPWVLCKSNQWC